MSQNQNVMIDETMETCKLEEIITEERHVNRRDRIEKSLKAVLQNMLRDEVPMVNMLCNSEILKGMIDELDENYTRKLMRRFRKTSKHANKDAEQETVDVAEAYSPPRMATMAAALGFNPGFSMDLTTVNNEGNLGICQTKRCRMPPSSSRMSRSRGYWWCRLLARGSVHL